MIITFDGESGSGKTALAKETAKKLNFFYISSGLIFRAFTYLWNANNGNIEKIKKQIGGGYIIYKWENDKAKIFINNTDCSDFLQSENIGNKTSKLAKNKKNYDLMVAMVRKIIKKSNIKNLVIDGRSVGKVFYPNAKNKFYVGANIKVRAARRYQQIKQTQSQQKYDDIFSQINERDARDKSRKHFPLKLENDTKYIDNTSLSIEDQVTNIIRELKINKIKI